MRSSTTFNILVEDGQHVLNIAVKFPEYNEVDGNTIFLYLLRELDEFLLIFENRVAGEDNNALALCFVLSVF
jgi:hypothetical protein